MKTAILMIALLTSSALAVAGGCNTNYNGCKAPQISNTPPTTSAPYNAEHSLPQRRTIK